LPARILILSIKEMNLENDDAASFHGYLMSSPPKNPNKATKGDNLDLLQFLATKHLTFGGPHGTSEDGMLECE